MSGLFLQQLVANSVCFKLAVSEVGEAMSSPINNRPRAVQTAGWIICEWDPTRSRMLHEKQHAEPRELCEQAVASGG